MPPSLNHFVLAVRLHHQQRKRDHLERGEDAAERHPRLRRADPVVVMARADDAAAQQNDELEVHRAQRGVRRHQAEPHHQESDHHHGEHFEHAFHPEVDQPPAPVIGHRDVAVLADEQREAVEHRDRRRRVEQQVRQAAAIRLRLQRRAQAAKDDEQPDPHAARSADTSTGGRVPDTPSPACRATTTISRACPCTTRYSPARLPTTTTTSAPNRMFTSSRCPFGSFRLPAAR